MTWWLVHGYSPIASEPLELCEEIGTKSEGGRRKGHKMTVKSKTPDAALAAARIQALDEAAAEASRMARAWRDEADGNHSNHHSELRRTWAEAAERVAEAIQALPKRHEPNELRATIAPQHQRPHHI